MFSSLFGKRRSSPVEDDTPPIPGAKPDDGFEIINPTPPRNNLYPSVSGSGVAYPQRPAPPAPVPMRPLVDQTFHYLQGVPFQFSRELQMASKSGVASEIADILAVMTSRLNMSGFEYDFNLEKSVLNEMS